MEEAPVSAAVEALVMLASMQGSAIFMEIAWELILARGLRSLRVSGCSDGCQIGD